MGGGMDFPPIPGNESHSLGLAVNQQGNPVVAWVNIDIRSEKSSLLIYQWDGSHWVRLGESGLCGPVTVKTGLFSETTTYFSPFPALAFDPSHHPVVACADGIRISLKTWDGAKWNELGGSATKGGVSQSQGKVNGADMALDSHGYPYVIWHENNQGRLTINLRYWNGAAWGELGGAAQVGAPTDIPGFISYPAIAVDGQDRPFVVWSGKVIPPTSGRFDGVFLKFWNGGKWEELGGSGSWRGLSNIEGVINRAAMILDAKGNPIVAWVVTPFTAMDIKPNRIYLRKWNGKEWIELGGSATDKGILTIEHSSFEQPSIALDREGRPIVACGTNANDASMIYIRRWDGTKWQELDVSDLKKPTQKSFSYSTIKTDKNGNLFIAWVDSTEDDAVKVHVKKIEIK